jgi:hypothetical protein
MIEPIGAKDKIIPLSVATQNTPTFQAFFKQAE